MRDVLVTKYFYTKLWPHRVYCLFEGQVTGARVCVYAVHVYVDKVYACSRKQANG